MRKGPGTNEQQIKSLQTRLSPADQQKAMSIARDFTPDVITLAYKLARQEAKKNKLPKSVSDMIAKLPPEEAKEMRDRLLQTMVDQPVGHEG